jgi:hypothetical protein
VRTALYTLVREQRATFARVACGEAGTPAFVDDAFERVLRCGVLAHAGRLLCRRRHPARGPRPDEGRPVIKLGVPLATCGGGCLIGCGC